MKKFLPLSLILISFFAYFSNRILAQISSSGIAIVAPISDPDAQDGDIICTYSDGNKRCQESYSTSILGVISDHPSAIINDPDLPSARPLINSGIAQVRVSLANGSISEGDFITTSEIAGVGQKAVRGGYVLGTALQDYSSDNPQEIAKIQVLVNIHPANIAGGRGNLLQFIREGITVPVFEPVESLRYILASLMVIISFSLGMIYFGRSSRTGIEAVGRNPLAKRVIQLTIFLNILLTIVIVAVGLGIAYLILIL